MRLVIAIPTVEGRKEQFNQLKHHIQNQINEFGLRKEIEIISLCDNKEISIGAKRQKLYEMSEGEYTVMIDDDDWVPYNYCTTVYQALEECPDVVGYYEKCQIGWQEKKSVFSTKYSRWGENIDGFDYVRSPFFKSPIKTELCLQTGVKDMRFGEDHDFAKRIYPLLKSEVLIPEYLYEYRYKHEPHNMKYGIKS